MLKMRRALRIYNHYHHHYITLFHYVSAKPRVMTPQNSVNFPKTHLKRAKNSEKHYKKWVLRAVFALAGGDIPSPGRQDKSFRWDLNFQMQHHLLDLCMTIICMAIMGHDNNMHGNNGSMMYIDRSICVHISMIWIHRSIWMTIDRPGEYYVYIIITIMQ